LRKRVEKKKREGRGAKKKKSQIDCITKNDDSFVYLENPQC
jgi:hypothetical protein